MVQYSVYARVCNGNDAVKKHEMRLNINLPKEGSVRLLVITEKQYESMRVLLGEKTYTITYRMFLFLNYHIKTKQSKQPPFHIWC